MNLLNVKKIINKYMPTRRHRITIRVDDELMKDLELISLLEGYSISFIVRTITKDYLDYYLFKNEPNR